jgi:hypothetical protein
LARLPQLKNLQITLKRETLFECLVGNMQLDFLSGLKKIFLLGHHVDRPLDIICGLAGLIAKTPQVVHLEATLSWHFSKDSDTARCAEKITWGPPTAIDSSGSQ